MPKRKINESIPGGGSGPDGLSTECEDRPQASGGLRNSQHGNVFQLKLLMLFLIRGISKNYQFELATEMPGLGGKFDNLVFKRQEVDKSTGIKRERYRYLQAKHKQDESVRITAAQLLKEDDGDFSLAKYFLSYCRDIKGRAKVGQSDNVQDCILCTNISVDKISLENEGIEL